MIDIKDLMMGNEVEFHGYIASVEELGVSENYIAVWADGKGYESKADIEHINPVPIAPEIEWLDSLTASKGSGASIYWQWLPEGCNCIVTIKPVKMSFFIVTIYSIDDDVSYFKGEKLIEYRHELQNFFRILTGKDLI